MNRARLQELLGRTKAVRIAVLGDFCLDKYLYIDASLDEPSLETGLTAFQVTGRKLSPGGAGNVCANLAALGAQVMALGVIGNDGEGYDLVRALDARGIRHDLVRSDFRCTSTYIKPMRSGDGGYTEQNRLDLKNFAPLSAADEEALLRSLSAAAEKSDAILVVDQFLEENCGTVNCRVKKALAEIAEENPELVIFADSRAFIHTFRECVIKCNNFEAVRIFDPENSDPTPAEVEAAGRRLSAAQGRPVYVTLGGEGMLVFSGDAAEHVPALRVSGPFDFCGAGDSASAGITLALALGASPAEAAALGNLVAAVTIRKIGETGTASPEELLALL
ncbi:MAG: carbohydrate kinase [Clostridia bacterium]|nr:carbohydrate kinase [Clostridia bacterium]